MAKVCIITGGTQGIGSATAELLASQGWRVVVSGRNAANGQKVVERITAANGTATFIRTDVTSLDDIKHLHEQTIKTYGRLDAAVNNAGISTELQPLGDSSTDEFERMWQVNVRGVYWCMQEQIRLMLPNGKGHIVNMSSAAGLHGVPRAGAYTATKHAVVGLTRVAALEYAQQGLYITAVAPGMIWTEINENLAKIAGMTKQDFAEFMPVKKVAGPDEIARAVAFLLASEFATGSVLEVDGGFGAG
ncbi:uncharacterized protein K452DRAFT_279737 [Aplosporella prunicola CBS 121167]|uniref:Ketoreductase domain-containing protein n=1 Tax=Aplosporella prunicola CBS 121167 TaxID=1176127 RepID=A0A6A6AZA4_9PEZI|nr:uncharacterized protein K452DRAFT_279737 [Aplosporella prunicola CBS 121167]KAF2136598.1 hypothetical protein K452DRAFT_279737 [Aplosporella prunicola CBS 121167]